MLIFVVLMNLAVCECTSIFHLPSKITFEPDFDSEYFGYAVVLTKNGLIVGAPKARSRTNASIATGLVFSCQISFLQETSKCTPVQTEHQRNSRFFSDQRSMKNFNRDDMWFGASLTPLSNDNLLLCAPRWTLQYKDSHMLAHGLCYANSKTDGYVIRPFNDMNRQAYIIDGSRKEYGEYGTHLNYYAYGQLGMSIKDTGNSSILIGAPGVMQWTGGIVEYKYLADPKKLFFLKENTINPYFTPELGPDNYFGYAVETGVFDATNEILFVAAAPRSKKGYGQVLIFDPPHREAESLVIRASLLGPQLGSYFGASLCCVDINGDDKADLLVGAPNFVMRNGDLPFDQGAVFVYLNLQQSDGFTLEEAGHVSGSSESGARFGIAIADLGDIDADGFNDVAIGAPYEDHGKGAVYIYRGSPLGLRRQYIQRIVSEHSLGFGLSVSKGLDLDGNKCNDLAVGAYGSSTAYVYRCIPTIKVTAAMKVPGMMDLPQNATNITALFCINVDPNPLWPNVQLDLRAKITVDREERRAVLSGDDEYRTIAKPGQDRCEEHTVLVKSTADLSRPITLQFHLEVIEKESKDFVKTLARLSDDSEMHSSFDMQLTRGCGDDLICKPYLVMTLEPLDVPPYIPGSGTKLGAKITILNKEEPAFGAKVFITLPLLPSRVPKPCTLKELNMTCNVPAPLIRNESVIWDIELEYTLNLIDEINLKVVADLEDPFYFKNYSGAGTKEVVLNIKPQANITVSGTALPNTTVLVTRQKLSESGLINLVHYFEIINYGPSDWPHLHTEFELSDNVSLSSPIRGCSQYLHRLVCVWSVPSEVTLPIVLTLRFNLSEQGSDLEEKEKLNITTAIFLPQFNKTAYIPSALVLEPGPPTWPPIVGSIAGLIVLAAIIYGLYRRGFFSRLDRERLKQMREADLSSEGPSSLAPTLPLTDESSEELLLDDSD